MQYKYNATCTACNVLCELNEKNEHLKNMCVGKKELVWPRTNIFFNLAAEGFIRSIRINRPNTSIAIINFSIENIRYFTNSKWLTLFSDITFKIILLCEKRMLALANHWRKKIRCDVILATKNINETTRLIRSAMFNELPQTKKSAIITANEISTLNLIFEGTSPSDISTKLNCSIRDVYRYKYSACRKIGLDIDVRNLLIQRY